MTCSSWHQMAMLCQLTQWTDTTQIDRLSFQIACSWLGWSAQAACCAPWSDLRRLRRPSSLPLNPPHSTSRCDNALLPTGHSAPYREDMSGMSPVICPSLLACWPAHLSQRGEPGLVPPGGLSGLISGCLQAHFNLGNYYRQTAKFEAAEFCYKAVVDVVPDHWRGLLNLAVAQVGLKRTSEAQRNLRRAFKASGARMHAWLPLRPCFPPCGSCWRWRRAALKRIVRLKRTSSLPSRRSVADNRELQAV